MDVRRRKYPSQIEGVESRWTTGRGIVVLGGGGVVVDLDGEVLDAAEVEEEVALDAEAAGGHEAQVQPPVANVLKYTLRFVFCDSILNEEGDLDIRIGICCNQIWKHLGFNGICYTNQP